MAFPGAPFNPFTLPTGTIDPVPIPTPTPPGADGPPTVPTTVPNSPSANYPDAATRRAELDLVVRVVFGNDEPAALAWLQDAYLTTFARMRFRGDTAAARAWLAPTQRFLRDVVPNVSVPLNYGAGGPPGMYLPPPIVIWPPGPSDTREMHERQRARVSGIARGLFRDSDAAAVAWLQDAHLVELARLLFDADADAAREWLAPLRAYARECFPAQPVPAPQTGPVPPPGIRSPPFYPSFPPPVAVPRSPPIIPGLPSPPLLPRRAERARSRSHTPIRDRTRSRSRERSRERWPATRSPSPVIVPLPVATASPNTGSEDRLPWVGPGPRPQA